MKDKYAGGLKFLNLSRIAKINALSHFRRCLFDDARNSKAWFLVGRCLEDLGRDHEALRAYKTCRRFGHLKAEYKDHFDVSRFAIRGLEVELEISHLKSGYTHLVHAAHSNKLSMFEKYLTSGEDIDQSDQYGGTPLCAAATHGHLEIVMSAIKAKADINKANSLGRTPLMLACQGNHVEVASYLLECGADIQVKDRERHTALWGAIFSAGSVSLCKLLLDHGASPQEEYDNGEDPLLLACAYGRAPIIELLLTLNPDIHAKNGQGNSPLALVVSGGNVVLAEKLLQLGADVNATNEYGHTALMQAVSDNSLPMIELLVQAGAFIDAETSYGETPLGNAQKLLSQGERSAKYYLGKEIEEILKKGKTMNGGT